jgi:modification methylase
MGFDFMGAIIWQKKTTMNTSGGAPIMGSYPFPPNGLVEIDYEFILIFKSRGRPKRSIRRKSKRPPN